MSNPTLYRKTPKGVDEIASSSRDLPRRLRTALILVDGQASPLELFSKLAVFCDPVVVIEQLCAAGLVEAIWQEEPAEDLSVSDFVFVE